MRISGFNVVTLAFVVLFFAVRAATAASWCTKTESAVCQCNCTAVISVEGFGETTVSFSGEMALRQTDQFGDPDVGICTTLFTSTTFFVEGMHPQLGSIRVDLDLSREQPEGAMINLIPDSIFPAFHEVLAHATVRFGFMPNVVLRTQNPFHMASDSISSFAARRLERYTLVEPVELAAPNGTVVARLVSSEIDVGGTLPEFISIMDGHGPRPHTFISPLGEGIPFDQFMLQMDVPLTALEQTDSVYTGPGPAPQVTSFVHQGDGLHTVMLDRPVAPGNWLKLRLEAGAEGPTPPATTSSLSTFFVWLGRQVLDMDQNGTTNIRDATHYGSLFRQGGPMTLLDINGDDMVNIRDASEFGNNWRGLARATGPWRGTRLPPRPE